MSDNLIGEIQEDIRRERLEKLWKEFGIYLIAAAILVVLVTALHAGWQSWNTKINTSQTGSMITALDSENPADALEQLAAGLRPDHRALSHLTAAGLLLTDGKSGEALAHYQSAEKARNANPALRDLAALMAVRLEWEQAGAGADHAALLARIMPLAADNNPWRHHARLQAAQIFAHGLRDYEAARAQLSAVAASQDAPVSLMERARALSHVYSLRQPIAEAVTEGKDNEAASEEPEG